MTTNVKPGDMARVVRPHKNVGLIVEVLEPANEADHEMLLDYSSDYDGSQVIWQCKIFGGGMSLDVIKNERTYALPGFVSLIWDQHLRRIEPPAQPETVTRTEEIAA